MRSGEPMSGIPPHRRVTLHDVGRAAGVSASTASRALGGDPIISLPTRERVRQAAERLDYVPNATARSLRRRATRTLGLLLPDVSDPVFGQVAAGFGREAAARGYSVIVVAGFTDPAEERRALRLFTEQRTDGVAVVSSILDPAEVLALARSDRVVFAQAEHPSLAGYRNDVPVGSIRSDDAAGVTAAVRYLLSAGYAQIGYVGVGATASDMTRHDAAEQALRAAGARPLRRFDAGPEDWRSAEAVARSVARDLPDAVICFDDKLALALMDGLRACGIEVPRDVAVVGFDGIPFAAVSNPRLTTIATPSVEIGQIAVRMLIGAIERGEMGPSVVLPVELVIRESAPSRRDRPLHSSAPAGESPNRETTAERDSAALGDAP